MPLAGREIQLDTFRADIFQQSFNILCVQFLGLYMEREWIYTFIQNIQRLGIGLFGAFHFDFLTHKPFIVVFLGTSEIRKLAGKGICRLQTFQVLHTVERFHLKSFVCLPNELLLEIRPFQVCGNFLHPLLSGNGRKVGEEFFFTVCHSLFKI